MYAASVNEDVVRSFVLHLFVDKNPFPPCGKTLGCVNDNATLAALAAVAAPASIPAGHAANSPGRSCGLTHNVNWFGIQPAVAAVEGVSEAPAGCYILGRGVNRIFTCYISRHVTAFEVYD
ncbi:hypothetical protein CDL15_Pgr009229 [Punica granatum]|uniref:Uncharacterized protein n=1 Tax=Punica granatum TaxID=22663 RepID=A0A218WUZ1_PUNGR|nr:hypothetical protein CDL15_Pgr009229 [Punica granatum]